MRQQHAGDAPFGVGGEPRVQRLRVERRPPFGLEHVDLAAEGLRDRDQPLSEDADRTRQDAVAGAEEAGHGGLEPARPRGAEHHDLGLLGPEDRLHPRRDRAQQRFELRPAMIDQRLRQGAQHRLGDGHRTGDEEQVLRHGASEDEGTSR